MMQRHVNNDGSMPMDGAEQLIIQTKMPGSVCTDSIFSFPQKKYGSGHLEHTNVPSNKNICSLWYESHEHS